MTLRALLMVLASSLMLIACGGGGVDCVEAEVAEQFGSTVRLSSFADLESLGFESDPPVPADAAIRESGVEEGGERRVVFTTESRRSEMFPIYQSTIGNCPEFGRQSGAGTSGVDAFQTDLDGVRLRVEFEDGMVTVTETLD
ncbi:MAG: hypothetical protein RIE08_15670 [Acidimicrobiales bacterium]